jgi:hypothetical protein
MLPARVRFGCRDGLLAVSLGGMLLCSLVTGTMQAGTLTVESGNSGGTPDILAYNAAHFYPGGNTTEWWRYSRVNGARVFLSPSNIEATDDIAGRGDGVTNQAGFLARKATLRADPLNTNYINWPYLTNRYQNSTLAGSNKVRVNHAFREMRSLGIQILANITADQDFLTITNAADWAGKWELWQHYYAQAFYLGREFEVQRYQMYNEPNHPNAGGLTQSDYLQRLQLASDAIQSALADVNTLYGRSLTPIVLAPVNSGGATGDSGWGDLVVSNRHVNFLGVTDTNFWLVQKYDYHQYNSSPSAFGNDLANLRSYLATTMAPEARFPTTISEFNVHTAAEFDLIPESPDSPAKYSRFGSIVVNLVKNFEKELYAFKFGQTAGDATDTYPVKKNGMHYVDNTNAPYHTGGVTKSGEVWRLFNKGFTSGRSQKNYTRGAGLDNLDLRAGFDPVVSNYYIFSANEASTGATMTVDTTAWSIPVGNRVLVEEVSEDRHGGGRTWGTIAADRTVFDGADNQLFQSGRTVWLFTLPSKPQEPEQNITATDDATVKDGTNRAANFGSLSRLTIRNDPTNTANRGAAFLKFRLPLLYPPDIQLAVLSLRASTVSSNTPVQAHIYGLKSNNWSQTSVTWSNAPNLRQNRPAGSVITNNWIQGFGTNATLLGQLVVSSTNKNERLIDVTEFLQSRTNFDVSILISQDPRWDLDLDTLTVGDIQPDAIEIISTEGAGGANFAPRLRLVRLQDSDGDGISNEAEVNVFGTNPSQADTDGDGVPDGLEALMAGTNPRDSRDMPGIASLARGASGSIQLLLNAGSNRVWLVQGSTNLTNWSTLLTTNPPSTPFNWTDTNAGSFLKRFYRVLLGP